jgi:hypothetical protein
MQGSARATRGLAAANLLAFSISRDDWYDRCECVSCVSGDVLEFVLITRLLEV